MNISNKSFGKKNSEIINKDKNNNKEDEDFMKCTNDYEMNNLSYEFALKYDKREFCEYYFSLIRTKQLIFFSFCDFNDYNSGIVKKFIFFLSFALHYGINALFFNDSTMHQIYEDGGKFNFIYQLPQIIYSTIISAVINILIKFLALSEKTILPIKCLKKLEDIDLKVKKTIKCLKIKFISFFVTTFILLLFFMYYIICFCGIYENTQIHLIKDSILSFTLSLLYPLLIYLLPGLLRISALRAPGKDKECLYNISKLFHFI
jgi:hypothetical protein